jgi:hypothetical protein
MKLNKRRERPFVRTRSECYFRSKAVITLARPILSALSSHFCPTSNFQPRMRPKSTHRNALQKTSIIGNRGSVVRQSHKYTARPISPVHNE